MVVIHASEARRESIFRNQMVKEGFRTLQKDGGQASRNDYMKARASVITISPGTINGKAVKGGTSCLK